MATTIVGPRRGSWRDRGAVPPGRRSRVAGAVRVPLGHGRGRQAWANAAPCVFV